MHDFLGCRLEGGLLHAAAAEAGARIICPDRPGIGHSSAPLSREYTLFDFAEDCAVLLKSLDIAKVSLLGFGEGAPAVLACASYFSGQAATGVDNEGKLQLCEIGIVAGGYPQHKVQD